MKYLILFTIFMMTLISDPAPKSIGVLQVFIGGFTFILSFMSLLSAKKLVIDNNRKILITSFAVYVVLFGISTLPSIFRDEDGLSGAMRSLTPYCVFIPLFVLGLDSKIEIRKIRDVFILIGIIHSFYLIYLFIFNPNASLGLTDYRYLRTTVLDPRTTHPLFFSSIFLPLSNIFGEKIRLKYRLFNILIVILSFFAGITTQTRSQIIAIICGVIFFVFFYFIYTLKRSIISTIIEFGKVIVLLLAFAGTSYIVVSPVRSITDAILQRNDDVGDNGRNGELFSVLNVYSQSSVFQILFGIGAGTEFSVEEAEDRSYVHNSIIYFLAYGGIVGLLVMIFLHYESLRILLKNCKYETNPDSLSFASLLTALFIYVQFFAVHKTLPYNLMLVLILSVSMKSTAILQNDFKEIQKKVFF